MLSRLWFLKLICTVSFLGGFFTLIAQDESAQPKPRAAREAASSPRIPNTAVEALPRGLVVFDGVHFKASHNNIIGTRAARAGGSYPGASSGLPLGSIIATANSDSSTSPTASTSSTGGTVPTMPSQTLPTSIPSRPGPDTASNLTGGARNFRSFDPPCAIHCPRRRS